MIAPRLFSFDVLSPPSGRGHPAARYPWWFPSAQREKRGLASGGKRRQAHSDHLQATSQRLERKLVHLGARVAEQVPLAERVLALGHENRRGRRQELDQRRLHPLRHRLVSTRLL